MSISIFSLRDKVTLRLLKLHFVGTGVVGWSMALDIRLRDWCCSVSMVWAQFRSREEQNLTAQESNSNTVWFNFQTIEHPFYGADVIQWSMVLHIMLSDLCYSVSMMWDQIPLREEQHLTAKNSTSNTVWFNFQTYIWYLVIT